MVNKVAYASLLLMGWTWWLPRLARGVETEPAASAVPRGSSSPRRTWAASSKLFYTPRMSRSPDSASRAAFARIAALDAILSDYQPESELMRLCDQAGGAPRRGQCRSLRRA